MDGVLLQQGLDALGLTASASQQQQLLAYGGLILKWNKVYNLTALRDPSQVLSHHLLDSLAVIKPLTAQRPGAFALLDVGSGAGLPGVVIAIMRPDIQVTCLDAVAKKMAFVQQAAAELGLKNLRGLHQRVEAHRGEYGVVASRAFASLRDFLVISRHLLAADGLWMAMKSRAASEEIAEMPPDARVFHVEQLQVPLLDAERCIVWAGKQGSAV